MLRFKIDLIGLSQSGREPAWRLHNNAVSPNLLLLFQKLIRVMQKVGQDRRKAAEMTARAYAAAPAAFIIKLVME
jgi:hypothetical protein